MVFLLLIFFIIIGLGLLLTLSIIDLKTYLLPNKYVFPFAITGIFFHFFSEFELLSVQEVFMGGALGYGILYLIRAAGNHYYGQDSLGLGDVKLLGAGGLWLGIEGVLMAMTLGAFLGLCHGAAVAVIKKMNSKEPFSFTKLKIPAGPGFALGIALVFLWNNQNFIQRLFAELSL
ncbi:MAG: A24 family peptidase [Pseudomonadota bacterium]